MYNLQSSPIFLMLPPLRFCLITESALNESLRMCSSSMNIRISQEDFVLKLEGDQEVSLRKGDWIALYPQILHMDPEVYEDPKVNAQLVLLFLLQAHCSSQAFCEGFFCCFFLFFFFFLLFLLVEQIFWLSDVFSRALQVKRFMAWREKYGDETDCYCFQRNWQLHIDYHKL